MTIELRPLDKGDVPALAALHAAAEAVDDAGEHYNEADIEEELANPDLELGKDAVGAFDGDDLVGYFSVMARKHQAERKAWAYGVTRPDVRGRGVGTMLVRAMVARAEEMQRDGDGPLQLLVGGLASNEAQASLLAAVGLKPDRWTFSMHIDLGDVPAPPPFPDGYAVRRFDPADGDRWLAAHNVAFLDHPNFIPWGASEWQQWVVGSRNFRGDLSFLVTLADRPEAIAAYVQTNEYDAHQQATGRREAYAAKVGTLPDHRGRGLATTLLRYCLAAYQAAGYDEAALDVDSMNPTGALAIYERAGFATQRRFVNYARVLG